MNSVKSVANFRVGYVPISSDFKSPGDSRRFIYYATQRNFRVEVADINKAYDFVVITQAADLSIWHKYTKAPIVFDFIDSYYALPKTDLKNLMRGFAKYISGKSKYLQLNYWDALEKMCRHSAAIICSTDEQMEILKPFNTNTHLILDIHEFAEINPKLNYKKSKPFRLIWEGLPQNINSLNILKNVISRGVERSEIELSVISDNSYFKYLGKYWFVDSVKEVRSIFPKAKFYEWSENNLIDLARNSDAAVIPIQLNDALASGKPENKLLLFWRLGLPVISSSTNAYKKAMMLSGFDLTCKSDLDWSEKLQLLINSEKLRKDVALAGFHVAHNIYSKDRVIEQWNNVIKSINLKCESNA